MFQLLSYATENHLVEELPKYHQSFSSYCSPSARGGRNSHAKALNMTIAGIEVGQVVSSFPQVHSPYLEHLTVFTGIPTFDLKGNVDEQIKSQNAIQYTAKNPHDVRFQNFT